MSKRKRNESSSNGGNYVAKKNRKLNIFAFILCLLIAFVAWLYASNLEARPKADLAASKDYVEAVVEDCNG